MKTLISYSINFDAEKNIGISLQSKSAEFRQEFQEILLLCAYAIRQMCNIGLKHPITIKLAETLSQVQNARDYIDVTVVRLGEKLIGLDPITKISTKDIRSYLKNGRLWLKPGECPR